MIGSLMGEIGLFPLGMILLTDGLKAAAGDDLRRWLQQLTGGAGKGMLSGTVITMLIQSSSATVLATIGSVSVEAARRTAQAIAAHAEAFAEAGQHSLAMPGRP